MPRGQYDRSKMMAKRAAAKSGQAVPAEKASKNKAPKKFVGKKYLFKESGVLTPKKFAAMKHREISDRAPDQAPEIGYVAISNNTFELREKLSALGNLLGLLLGHAKADPTLLLRTEKRIETLSEELVSLSPVPEPASPELSDYDAQATSVAQAQQEVKFVPPAQQAQPAQPAFVPPGAQIPAPVPFNPPS